MSIHRKTQSGFTLIEMIVALAVFATVITISVGALLMLIATNEQLQNEQSVMTNLSFALDSMTREIRTGTHYYCAARPNETSGGEEAIFAGNTHEELGYNTRNCEAGNNNGHRLQGVSIIEGGDSITQSDSRILYFFDADQGQLFRRVGNGPAQSIVSSGIYITDAEFYVSGAEPQSLADESAQPTVTLFIEARESDSLTAKPYRIQTTITQRTLDI